MKCFILFTGSGPVVILTSYSALTAPALLGKLNAKGIDKFLAFEVPVDLARERYGGHFHAVVGDVHQSDDLRVLDFNGERAFRLFRFGELGAAITHENDETRAEVA